MGLEEVMLILISQMYSLGSSSPGSSDSTSFLCEPKHLHVKSEKPKQTRHFVYCWREQAQASVCQLRNRHTNLLSEMFAQVI